MKPSVYYFYVKPKILVDFHICINGALTGAVEKLGKLGAGKSGKLV